MKSDMVLSRTSSSSGSYLGDYIGMESCCDLEGAEDSSLSHGACSERRWERDRYRHQRCSTAKREVPPPIPLLACTGNLPSRMPWMLKRYYTSDGRLILSEEKVRQHEYFRTQRSNGRLTLQLVPLNDDVLAPPPFGEIVDEEVEAETIEGIDDEVVNDEEEEEEMMKDETVLVDGVGTKGDKINLNCNVIIKKEHEEPMMKVERSTADKSAVENSNAGLGTNGGTCFNYSKLTANSSRFLGLPVSAIRPVLS